MKGKTFFVLFVVAVIGTVFMSNGVGASVRAKTQVTIEGPNGDFQGEILSSRKACLGNREVKVYEQAGDVQSPSTDQQIGSDTSSRVGTHGEWSIGNSGFKTGKFYARAAKTDRCKTGKSETITL